MLLSIFDNSDATTVLNISKGNPVAKYISSRYYIINSPIRDIKENVISQQIVYSVSNITIFAHGIF